MGTLYDPENPPSGPELLDEPNFDALGAWEMDPGWTVAGNGLAVLSAPASTPTLYQYVAGLIAGKTYYSLVNISTLSGKLRFALGASPFCEISVPGTYCFPLVPTAPALPYTIRSSVVPTYATLRYCKLSDTYSAGYNVSNAIEPQNFLPHGTKQYDIITDTELHQCFRVTSLEDFSHCLFQYEP